VRDSKKVEKYNKFTERVLKALDYEEGVFHLEAIESESLTQTSDEVDGDLNFLEIAIRPGGGNAEGLALLGYDPRKAYIQSQLGNKMSFTLNDQMMIVFELMTPLDLAASREKHSLSKFNLDLEGLESFKEGLSMYPKTTASLFPDRRYLMNLKFVGEDEQKVIDDAHHVLNTMNIELIVRGGPYYFHTFKPTQEGWVHHKRETDPFVKI
jgi:hypothetical protein